MLSESSRDLGHGDREVARSQVNGPGSFEGVGHFTFVYYKDAKLCQCGQGEVAISPDGAYALCMGATTGQLSLFQASSGARRPLTASYAGVPVRAAWEAQRVVVTLERYQGGIAHTSQQVFSL